ncbi:MAG TPA: ankyrin repeat domain-containing protein, partial [Candidatus Solibacter sp.]|nr:ankyrin repeat domain-containing protein [Candidatus Solibacter sp.]
KESINRNNIETRDRRSATLLMHAAAFGNLETLRLLIDRGANVNAKNDFDATALLWAARDPEKARLLVEHGADVNARSKQGRTPLMLASLRHGGSQTVALLLAKGSEVNVKDGKGDTALGLAASIGEVESMRMLLARGADPDVRNARGESPLIYATKCKSGGAVKLLLQKRVEVNAANTSWGEVRNGLIAQYKLTPLHRAVAIGTLQTVRDLLAAGADIHARDIRSLTPLHFAVATEYQTVDMVRVLIGAGADVSARDNNRETPLDWAEKFGYPEVIGALKAAHAEHGGGDYHAPKAPEGASADAPKSLQRSIGLLEKTSAEFFRQSGCVGCHHQPLVARAQLPAKSAGIAVNVSASADQLSQLKAQWLSSQEEFLQSINPGGGPNRLAENLLGFAAAGYPADAITDAAIVDLAEAQAENGSWADGEEQARPPITESVFGGTARAIRAIRTYGIPARGREFDARIALARSWLERTTPRSTDDYAMRLLGLYWASASKEAIAKSASELIALQRKDGGWAGNPYLKSDAFATGESLVALIESGTGADAVRRGVGFLLATQYPDGSWYVRSRSIKFQPYFESGFPFGHDQWISTAGTAWAAQAIALSLK